MTEREAVRLISRKTMENSLIMPGKVVFGLWKRKTGEVTITDALPDVSERIRLGYEVIRVYADGCELEPLGNHGNIAMVHMNRRLFGEIRGM